MPLYEYQCARCGETFEKLAAFSDVPACPACGAKETEKKVTCCARYKTADNGQSTPAYSGGCGGCSGGNCASCGR